MSDWGRTKKSDIKRLMLTAFAQKVARRLVAADFMEYARQRRVEGAGPSTTLNDLVWLRQALMHAAISTGSMPSLAELDLARAELLRTRVVAKSRHRDRRMTLEEERKLLEFFEGRDARSQIPMARLMRFAVLTARRESEICRMQRAEVDFEKRTGWLDDVKHPRQKKGNRRQFRMPDEALDLICEQPVIKGSEDLVFPYNPSSVSNAFTKTCKLLEINGLRFHDLRHEATSRLFERGYNIQEVAQFTLHESWATLKRYTHLKPEHVPERGPAAT